jgi:hypothetical protein
MEIAPLAHRQCAAIMEELHSKLAKLFGVTLFMMPT